jgi:RND family efflux transporter MFP subunit
MKLLPCLISASLLSGAWFAFSGCKPRATIAAASPVSVQFVEAQQANNVGSQTGPAFLGIVKADTETLISFKVAGQIMSIGAEGDSEDWREGTPITQGTVLAKLDPSDYITAVNAARARTQYTRSSFARFTELYAAASISKNDFDAARAQMETAEAELEHAEQNLRDTVIHAPYSGTLLSRYQKKGEVTGAGRPVLRIGDFQRVAIEVGVPETLLAEIAVGQEYPVRLNAFNSENFTGSISEIGFAAAEGSRLFRVVLKVPNSDGRLKSGMTASVRFGRAPTTHPDSVIIPLSALFSEARAAGASADATSVYVIGADNIARSRVVVTGDLIASSVIVHSGLKAGEKVVTAGTAQLHNGALVAATPAK